MKSDFNIRLQGFPAANRDARISLRNVTTGHIVSDVRPFLDGTATVRGLDPGEYEVEVKHPNLANPITKDRIRLFPQPHPTIVNIPIPRVLFEDSPIADVPDADLGPVQSKATAAKGVAASVGGKLAGNAILAADWNQLAGAVADIADAVLQLTSLVAPKGHAHPEIAAKIDEVQGNIRRFTEAFGKSLLEIRREIEAGQIHDDTAVVLPNHTDLIEKIKDLKLNVQNDPIRYTQDLTNVGNLMLDAINKEAQSRGPDAGATFLKTDEVQRLTERARTFADAGVQTSADNELKVYQQSKTKVIRVGRKP
jgi:hypothetical protein